MVKTCVACSKSFEPSPQVKEQTYCPETACQKKRKAHWQKEKLSTDTDYKMNQVSAQKEWRMNNPDYWKQYRLSHQIYAERNRQLQRNRNQKRGGHSTNSPFPQQDNAVAKSIAKAIKEETVIAKSTPEIAKEEPLIAKMDASTYLKSGLYVLAPFFSGVIAKMDAIIVQISAIYAESCDCKEGLDKFFIKMADTKV